MAEPDTLPTPRLLPHGAQALTPEEGLARLTSSMLQRLPASLWDQDPASVQGQLYAAMAAELLTWLDAWEVTRDCTLLQRAEGIDLDTLLVDYALKRYNQRQDPYARQIARQVLFSPKETLFALQDVAQLLTDYPQLVARSGRNQPHYWIAATHNLHMPRTYWQLTDHAGTAWYLSLEGYEIIVTSFPASGANVTPLPDGTPVAPPPAGPWHTWGYDPAYATGRGDVETLHWFLVPDSTGAPWVITLNPGGALEVGGTVPAYGRGTTHPLRLLDGTATTWGLMVDEVTRSLVPVVLSEAEPVSSYWQLREPGGAVRYLAVEDRELWLVDTPPLGWADTTPGAQPLDWFTVTTPDDGTPAQTAYAMLSVDGDLVVQPTQPTTGTGTAEVPIVVSRTGNTWRLDLCPDGHTLIGFRTVLVIQTPDVYPLLTAGATAETLALLDEGSQPWWLSIATGELAMQDSPEPLTTDVTPTGGPFRWWRLAQQDGTRLAVTPVSDPCLAVQSPAPAGTGTATPTRLGDASGAWWHTGIAPDGSIGVSDYPPLDFAQAATCLVLTDPAGVRWFWRMAPTTGELVCSRVQEPDTIPWMRQGEVTWLHIANPRGGRCYLLPDTGGEPMLREAPPITNPWGMDAEDALTYCRSGRPWLLALGEDESLAPTPLPMEDIPPDQPLIHVRDLYEALGHVEAAGTLTTLYVS